MSTNDDEFHDFEELGEGEPSTDSGSNVERVYTSLYRQDKEDLEAEFENYGVSTMEEFLNLLINRRSKLLSQPETPSEAPHTVETQRRSFGTVKPKEGAVPKESEAGKSGGILLIIGFLIVLLLVIAALYIGGRVGGGKQKDMARLKPKEGSIRKPVSVSPPTPTPHFELPQ